MAELPEVTEILRWEYRSGDRLIMRTDHAISRKQAYEVAAEIRARLQLPDDVPLIIAGEGWSFEVLSGVD